MSDSHTGRSHEDADDEVMRRLSCGDEAAFRTLFERYERLVYRAALAKVRCPWEAEDVVASSFLELWRKREDVRIVEGSAAPWLLKVAGFISRNHLRADRRRSRLIAKIPCEDPAPDPADDVARALDASATVASLADVLGESAEWETRVLVRCILAELSTRDAASILGVPDGTVKSRVHRLRGRLRRRLGGSDAI